MTLEPGETVPHMYKVASAPNSPTKKPWREAWLESIESEIKYTVEELTPSPQDAVLLKLNSEWHTIRYLRVLNNEESSANLYKWHYLDKVVITDVDGTITKSDLRGHLYTKLGYDYTHDGIAKLFHQIVKRNYRIIYLTARTASQLQETREYIYSLQQTEVIKESKLTFSSKYLGFPNTSEDEDELATYKMPHGPIFTCYNKMLNALVREVVLKRPDVFKVKILQVIAQTFGEKIQPYVAGFGNRKTDDESYTAVGIPAQMCFRINKKSVIEVDGKTFTNGYKELLQHIDTLFPVHV